MDELNKTVIMEKKKIGSKKKILEECDNIKNKLNTILSSIENMKFYQDKFNISNNNFIKNEKRTIIENIEDINNITNKIVKSITKLIKNNDLEYNIKMLMEILKCDFSKIIIFSKKEYISINFYILTIQYIPVSNKKNLYKNILEMEEIINTILKKNITEIEIEIKNNGK